MYKPERGRAVKANKPIYTTFCVMLILICCTTTELIIKEDLKEAQRINTIGSYETFQTKHYRDKENPKYEKYLEIAADSIKSIESKKRTNTFGFGIAVKTRDIESKSSQLVSSEKDINTLMRELNSALRYSFSTFDYNRDEKIGKIVMDLAAFGHDAITAIPLIVAASPHYPLQSITLKESSTVYDLGRTSLKETRYRTISGIAPAAAAIYYITGEYIGKTNQELDGWWEQNKAKYHK